MEKFSSSENIVIFSRLITQPSDKNVLKKTKKNHEKKKKKVAELQDSFEFKDVIDMKITRFNK